MRVTVPSSASKMMAHLCSVGVPIWRARQFAEALSWPSANHWKNGAFDAASARGEGRVEGAGRLARREAFDILVGLGAQRLIAGHAGHAGRVDDGVRRWEYAV